MIDEDDDDENHCYHACHKLHATDSGFNISHWFPWHQQHHFCSFFKFIHNVHPSGLFSSYYLDTHYMTKWGSLVDVLLGQRWTKIPNPPPCPPKSRGRSWATTLQKTKVPVTLKPACSYGKPMIYRLSNSKCQLLPADRCFETVIFLRSKS